MVITLDYHVVSVFPTKISKSAAVDVQKMIEKEALNNILKQLQAQAVCRVKQQPLFPAENDDDEVEIRREDSDC